FTLFTYVRPFLETVTQAHGSVLSLVLLVIGVAGFIGTVLIGRFIDGGLYRTLIAIPMLMAAIAGFLMIFGASTAAVAALLGVWGLVATAAPVGWWSWVAQTFAENAEAGGGLMVAVVQCAIALGSTIGGLLFDHSGYRSTFLASAAVLLIAALLTLITSRSDTSR
ncbi:MFS transporter, partial [Solirubrobacter sp. CPCC 204708]|nr:MFS transporter [Solirubrobacter deserti]